MVKPTLSQVRTIGDFLTPFRWELVIREPLNFLGATPGARGAATPSYYHDLGGASGVLDALQVLCTSVDMPSKSTEKMTIDIRGHRHFQPGIMRPGGSLTIHFVETVDSHIAKLLMYWQESIWQMDSGAGTQMMRNRRPTNSATTDGIFLMRLNSLDRPAIEYQLLGAFLEGYQQPPVDSSSPGPVDMTMTLSYDDFRVKIYSQV
jgi:hypothetical protein